MASWRANRPENLSMQEERQPTATLDSLELTEANPPQRTRVKSLAKRLEKSIIFPQRTHRLVPACDPADRRDSTDTLTQFIVDDFTGESIIPNARHEVVSQDIIRGENRLPFSSSEALTPHRFGGGFNTIEGDETVDTDSNDDGGWGGSDEFLTSGTDSLTPPDSDSHSEVSSGDLEESKTVVDGKLSLHVRDHVDQASLDPLEIRSPDLVSDTFMDLSNNIYRRLSFVPPNFDDFIEVKWNASKHPPPALPPCSPDLSDSQRKRRCIFDNLISTENNYVASLEHLVDHYDGALQTADPQIITKDDRRSIFYMLRHLLQIHRTFQISLHDAAINWDKEESVALVFTACFSRVTVRRVYAAYINNYDSAMERVKLLESSNKAFTNFLKKQQRNSTWRLALNGLMVKPIQRFPQFILLLQDLLKNTDEDHPQYYHLQRALSDIQALANFLNETKRIAHQKIEAKNLMRDLHIHFVCKEDRQVLRLLDTVEAEYTTYTEAGTLSSRCKQRLALFNIMIVCYMTDQTDQLKTVWTARLPSVTVKSRNITPDMRVNVRKDSLGHTVIRRRERVSSVGNEEVRQRMEELQAMMHDLAVLTQISQLGASLQMRYRGFNELRLESLCTQLQRWIQQKNDENRLTDSSYLELQVTSFSKDAERRPTKGFVFNLDTPTMRNAWVDRFMRQKLSEENWNLPTWASRDERNDPADSLLPFADAPLFISSAIVDISRSMGEVNCAVPVCLVYGTLLKRHVWCCHETGGITVFSLYMHKPMVSQSFPCQDLPPNSSFWCVELVPGAIESPDPRHQADMVWAGTNTGIVVAFSLLEEERKRPFLRINAGAPVVSLCYAADRVFAGLHNGQVIIHERDAKGYWSMLSPIDLGEHLVLKICALSGDEGAVVMACEDVLFTVHPDPSGNGFTRDPMPMEGDDHIQDFVVGGQTAWIAFQNSLILRLMHLKTHLLIQTIDLAPTINVVDNMKEHDFQESITCMSMTKRLLLIGTRAGHLCKVPLQQIVPVSSGPCSLAYHKHRGPVRFIISFKNMVERLVHAMSCEEEIDTEDQELEDYNDELMINDGERQLNYERKPSLDQEATNSSRRLSLMPLKNKWMSNPNLLLSLQENEANDDMSFGNLMVDIDMESISEESSALSTPANSRKTSNEPHQQGPELLRPLEPMNDFTELQPPVHAPDESDSKMWLEDVLIVTGGLGYQDIKGRRAEERMSEPCLNCWCE